MKRYIYILMAISILACASLTSATTNELHILTTDNTTWVWLNDESPFECGEGTQMVCNLETPDSNTSYNASLVEGIFGNLTSVSDKVDSMEQTLKDKVDSMEKTLKFLNTTFINSNKDALTISQATNLFDRTRNDILTGISTRLDEKINPFVTNAQTVSNMRINMTRQEGTITSLNNQVITANEKATTCASSLNDSNNAGYLLFAIIALLIATSLGYVPWLKKKTP